MKLEVLEAVRRLNDLASDGMGRWFGEGGDDAPFTAVFGDGWEAIEFMGHQVWCPAADQCGGVDETTIDAIVKYVIEYEIRRIARLTARCRDRWAGMSS